MHELCNGRDGVKMRALIAQESAAHKVKRRSDAFSPTTKDVAKNRFRAESLGGDKVHQPLVQLSQIRGHWRQSVRDERGYWVIGRGGCRWGDDWGQLQGPPPVKCPNRCICKQNESYFGALGRSVCRFRCKLIGSAARLSKRPRRSKALLVPFTDTQRRQAWQADCLRTV